MAQHIGILHAGVPSVERPYFLPAKKEKEKNDEGREAGSLCSAAIQEAALRSQAIVENAAQAYPLIDIRDLENVDLLIYYFETGRADDMKEALQLVDRQRQTDQITKALQAASESIRKTIHQSMAQLGTALAKSFSVLSTQLAMQHGEMMQGIEAGRSAAEAQTRAVQEQTTALVSAQSMNEALLKKIDTSSSQLAAQMDRQMKEVHHLY